MTHDIPRVPMLEQASVSPEVSSLYDKLIAQRGVVPNMFKVLAYTPGIAQSVAGFLTALLSDGALKGYFKELIAVRVSMHQLSEYAVRAHTASARKKGATEDQISALENFEAGPFDEKQKIAFRLADKLHQGGREVDDHFFAQLKTLYSEPEIVELFMTAAAFEMFPRFIDGLRLPVTVLPPVK